MNLQQNQNWIASLISRVWHTVAMHSLHKYKYSFITLLTTQPTDLCKLRPDSGPCLALIRSYFFNSSSGRCETFNYGGCKGNANRCVSLIMNNV